MFGIDQKVWNEKVVPTFKLDIENIEANGIKELVIVVGDSSFDDVVNEISRFRERSQPTSVTLIESQGQSIASYGKNQYTITNKDGLDFVMRGLRFNSVRFIK